MIKSLPVARWNFGKADWKKFRESIDKNVCWFNPEPSNFTRFAGVVLAAAKRAIPRGFRKNYIPTWSKDCEVLWNQDKETDDIEIGTIITADTGKTVA